MFGSFLPLPPTLVIFGERLGGSPEGQVMQQYMTEIKNNRKKTFLMCKFLMCKMSLERGKAAIR
jgi:hypothetical protein